MRLLTIFGPFAEKDHAKGEAPQLRNAKYVGLWPPTNAENALDLGLSVWAKIPIDGFEPD